MKPRRSLGLVGTAARRGVVAPCRRGGPTVAVVRLGGGFLAMLVTGWMLVAGAVNAMSLPDFERRIDAVTRNPQGLVGVDALPDPATLTTLRELAGVRRVELAGGRRRTVDLSWLGPTLNAIQAELDRQRRRVQLETLADTLAGIRRELTQPVPPQRCTPAEMRRALDELKKRVQPLPPSATWSAGYGQFSGDGGACMFAPGIDGDIVAASCDAPMAYGGGGAGGGAGSGTGGQPSSGGGGAKGGQFTGGQSYHHSGSFQPTSGRPEVNPTPSPPDRSPRPAEADPPRPEPPRPQPRPDPPRPQPPSPPPPPPMQMPRNIPSPPPPPPLPPMQVPTGAATLVMFIMVLLAAIAAGIAWHRYRRRHPDEPEPPPGATVDPGERLPGAIEAAPQSLYEQAMAAAAAGRFEEAVRLMTLASLVALDEHRILSYNGCWTNGEYLAALRAHTRHQKLFERPIQLFDRMVYGMASPGRQDFDVFRRLFDDIRDGASGQGAASVAAAGGSGGRAASGG